MKRFIFTLIFALIVLGAFCMSYSDYWAFDVLGGSLIVIGGIIATVKTLKLENKALKITLLCLLYLAIILLLIAGSVRFSGTIILAIMGAAALVTYGFLIYTKAKG